MFSSIISSGRIGRTLMYRFMFKSRLYSTASESIETTETTTSSEKDSEFRTLELYKKKDSGRTFRQKRERLPPKTPRYTRMQVDQDWTSVWPTAQSFKASVVPLPLRMGYSEKGAPPGKYGNAELMKIPNFLHLTPPAIKKHCAAIAKFCTQWPLGLEKDEDIEHHFPVVVTTTDYCYSGPSIRNPAARIVTLQLKLSSIELDEHARDKLLRLVGERYDLRTNTLTLVMDRCPMRKQNYDYGVYLLTALFHESWKTESWEGEKDELDMEKYVWDGSKSQSVVVQIVKDIKEAEKDDSVASLPATSSLQSGFSDRDIVELKTVSNYGQMVTKLHNEGEDTETVNNYKESVKKLLNLSHEETSIVENVNS